MTDLVLLKMRSQYSNSLHKTLSKNVLMIVIVWSYCYQGGLLNYTKLYFHSKSCSMQVNVKRQDVPTSFPPELRASCWSKMKKDLVSAILQQNA